MSPSSNANVGRQMPRRDEEFLVVLIVDESGVSTLPRGVWQPFSWIMGHHLTVAVIAHSWQALSIVVKQWWRVLTRADELQSVLLRCKWRNLPCGWDVPDWMLLWASSHHAIMCHTSTDTGAGLADLNQCDLNHWFQSRFKSIDFFVRHIVKHSGLNRTDDFTSQWKTIIK